MSNLTRSHMRILHVLHNSLPLLCGYSIRSGYIVNLQRAMGLTPYVVTSGQHPNGPDARERIEGVEYRRTPAYRSGRRVPFAREWSLMNNLAATVEEATRDFRPDVIHAHSPVLVGLPALRVAQRLRVPIVYEVRDLWENACVDRGRFSERSPLYAVAKGLESYVLRRAHGVVTICDQLRQELTPRVGRRSNKLFVVPNGVDTAGFCPREVSAETVEKWRLSGRDVILYAGTFQPYEGLDLLLHALAMLVHRRPTVHLVIVGGSVALPGQSESVAVQEDVLRSVILELGLGEHVTFTGRVPHEYVKEMYAVARVVAYPRRLTRTTALTTPLKPLEAMSMGKAVVISDVPAMKELVTDGETGLTFRAGDAADLAEKLDLLIGDSHLRERLGRAAREWVVQRRQWPVLIAEYVTVYRAAIAHAVGSAAHAEPRASQLAS